MCHHNIARLRREELLHKYTKTAKINTNVIESRQPAIIARNSIWKQQCWDRHVFSTHKALNPSQSIPFLLLMATWILPFKSGEKTKVLYSILNSNKYMRSAYTTIMLARPRRQELLETLPKKNFKYKNTTKQMSPIIHNQIQKKIWSSIWKQQNSCEPFTPHILLLMFNLHANQILPLRSGDKSELIYRVLVNGRSAYAIAMLARLRGEELLHTLLKNNKCKYTTKLMSPVSSNNQIQGSEKQSGSSKCETSTSEDSRRAQVGRLRGDMARNAPEKNLRS